MADDETTAPSRDDLAAEVRDWAGANWDPDLTVREWWERLAGAGLSAPMYPHEWGGRSLARGEAGVVAAALIEAGALGAPGGLGLALAGPTILAHGSDEQKARYLPGIVTGQEGWCQLFSEPEAGSDLASLQCRAERDGDEWVITGQKVWTSGGQHADLGMLIARTDLDAPKHRGISYFAIAMDQPGIEVRPLVEMTGRALFNEVFLDEARVPHDALIGDQNAGWGVAMTTLANERAGLGGGGGGVASLAVPGSKLGHLDRRAGDFVEAGARGGAGTALGGMSHRLIQQVATERSVVDDPLFRQDLMRLYAMDRISRWTVQRAKSGGGSGGEANIAKLMMSRMTRLARDLGLRTIGPAGTLTSGDTPGGGVLQAMALFSPAVSIYGGSDQVQRNIVGERVLGLPKEPGDTKNTPFRELNLGGRGAP